ncbi:MAG: hypothetical protein ABI968_06835 [Acidobacteriota bacterium]
MTLKTESFKSVAVSAAVSRRNTRLEGSSRRRAAITDMPKSMTRSPIGYPMASAIVVKSCDCIAPSGASSTDQTSMSPPKNTVATSSQNCRASLRVRRKRGKESRPSSNGT